MRLRTAASMLLCCCFLVGHAGLSFAQQDQSALSRKVVSKVVPQYPSLAHTMNLGGTVKVEALVASNGTVKSVEIKGGHPVLAQAAAGAVSKWKWEPASHETREPVEVKFNPR